MRKLFVIAYLTILTAIQTANGCQCFKLFLTIFYIATFILGRNMHRKSIAIFVASLMPVFMNQYTPLFHLFIQNICIYKLTTQLEATLLSYKHTIRYITSLLLATQLWIHPLLNLLIILLFKILYIKYHTTYSLRNGYTTPKCQKCMSEIISSQNSAFTVDCPQITRFSSHNQAIGELTILQYLDMCLLAVTNSNGLKYSNYKGIQLINELGGISNLLCAIKLVSEPLSLKEQVNKCFIQANTIYCKVMRCEKGTKNSIVYYAKLQYICAYNCVLIELRNKYTSQEQVKSLIMEIISCSLYNEMNTLLNGINGNIEMLESSIPNEIYTYYKNANQFCKILSLKLRDIDDLNQIRHNIFRLHIKKFRICELLSAIKNTIGFFAELKQINLIIDTKYMSAKEIITDYDRLFRVLINIAYMIIDKIQFGSIMVKVDFPHFNDFDVCILIKTQEKEQLSSLFKFKPPRQISDSPIQNFEGISITNISYIADKLGKGIEYEDTQSYSIVHVKVMDGFNNIRLESKKQHRRKSSTTEGVTEEVSSITSTGRSQARLVNKSKVTALNGYQHLSVFTYKPYSLSEMRRKYSEISADLLDVADEKTGVFMVSQAKCVTEINKVVPPSILCSFSNNKIRKDRCNSILHSSSQCLIHGVSPSNLSNEDNFQFNAIIADDNFTNQFVLKGLLKLFHINSVAVNNGKECLQLVKSLIDKNSITYVKIIFMDLQMPVMNGIEATKQLLLLMSEGRFRVPIIGISSDNSENDRKQFYNSGIAEFVEKPISKSKLGVLLSSYLNDRK